MGSLKYKGQKITNRINQTRCNMTGRPLPTKLKIFKGTDKKIRLNENEPEPLSDNIVMPEHLSKKAKKQWEKIVEQLTGAGIMTNLDQDALELYCEAYAKWADANDKLRTHGMVVKAPSGYPIPSPYLSIANKAFEQLRQMMIEFGMTPSSRTRIKAEPRKTENDFDGF